MKKILVLVTAQEISFARELAKELVSRKLAACINILPSVESIYEWEGKMVQESEVMMLIKTKKERFEVLKETILQMHPYEVPEILAFDIDDGSSDYLGWIEKVVK